MRREILIFCENIKLLREYHNLTLTGMAQKLNITEQELIMLEKGVIPNDVTVEIIMRIYQCFGILPKDQFEQM